MVAPKSPLPAVGLTPSELTAVVAPANLMSMEFLLFDCETTGLPRSRHFSPDDVSGWPHLVQLAWALYDAKGSRLESHTHIVKPQGFRIPADATRIHGISHDHAVEVGEDLGQVITRFMAAASRPSITIVAHNLDYDRYVVMAELIRLGHNHASLEIPGICTMKTTTDLCALARPGGYGFKWPTLSELHVYVFGSEYEGAHDAGRDLEACARCFFKLLEAGHYKVA